MTILFAVPSDAPGGVDADISGHFGHCDAFSLFRIDNGRVVETTIIPAEPHDNCLAPVRLLALRGVTAIAQPGGSLRDYEVIGAVNEASPQVAMVFTGQRSFKH